MPTWDELLIELKDHKDQNGQTIKGLSFDELRHKYLEVLSNLTGRNVIAYYSGWLSVNKKINTDINDSDMTGFMNALKGLDCAKGLDLLLHTPGGNPTATEGIVKYLHSKFRNNIRVIVPHMAMSAGTMLACSAKEIIMGKHSFLGPIDPQYGGIPAYNIIQEYKDAKQDMDKNPKSRTYWELQLMKYPIAFFYTVCDAIHLSSELASKWLFQYMFEGEDVIEAKKKVKRIVKRINANNKSHARHFSCETCKEIGLKVNELENNQEFQDAVLSAHHTFVITFDSTKSTKIIENHIGSRYVTAQN